MAEWLSIQLESDGISEQSAFGFRFGEQDEKEKKILECNRVAPILIGFVQHLPIIGPTKERLTSPAESYS